MLKKRKITETYFLCDICEAEIGRYKDKTKDTKKWFHFCKEHGFIAIAIENLQSLANGLKIETKDLATQLIERINKKGIKV